MLDVKEPRQAARRQSGKRGRLPRANINISKVMGMDVGGVFARRRHALGMTQVEVAAISGITDGYISMIERNVCNASLFLLITLSESLGMTFSQVMLEAETRAKHV